MPDVLFVGASTAQGSDGGNITIAKPAGVQEGDYLLAGHTIDLDGIATYLTDMTASGGATWVEDTTARGTVASCNAYKTWKKFAGASEPANYTFTTSPPANGNSDSAVIILAFRYVDTTTPHNTPTMTTNTGTANTSHTAPSQTGVTGGMVVTFHSSGNSTENTKSYTPGTGLASATERGDAGTLTSWVGLAAYTESLTSTAATGTRTATALRSTRHRSTTFVLRPSAVVAPVADAGADASVETGSEFARTGSGTNTPTSYSWSLTSAPAGVTTGVVSSAAALSYTPTVAGTYVFTLSATNAGGTGTDNVTLTATAPAAGTLGKTTAGASSSASSSNKVAVSKVTATGSGTLTAGHIRASLTGGTTTIKAVVYADSGGAPGALLAQSSEYVMTNTTEQVLDVTFSGGAIVSGTDYWVGASWADPGTDSVNLFRDNTASARQEANFYVPDPFGTPTALSGPVAVWVEYGSVGGGGGSVNPVIRSFAENVSSTTTCVVNKPAGLDVDDYLLAAHAGDADVTALTAAGFTALSESANNSTSNIPRGKLWGKVATSTDVAASTFTFGCTSGGTPAQGVTLMAIQKGTYDPTTPITIGTWTTQARVTSAVQTLASILGVDKGLLLGLFVTDANGNAQTYPTPASSMDLVNQAQSASGYSMHAVYSQLLAAAGATGAKTTTPTGATTTQNGWATLPALINPAPVAADYTKFFLSVV